MLKFLYLAESLAFYQKVKIEELVFNEYAEEDEAKRKVIFQGEFNLYKLDELSDYYNYDVVLIKTNDDILIIKISAHEEDAEEGEDNE